MTRTCTTTVPRRLRLVTTSAAAAGAVAAAVAVAAPVALAGPSATPSWRLVPTGTADAYRGLSPVSSSVAWVGGYGGIVLRTTDGGVSWLNVSPRVETALQFRDVQAFDADHAVAMASGTRGNSRLYLTSNGGRSWTETFRNTARTAFFDCMTFFDRRHGLVLSDPVDGKFRILATGNGGRSWHVQSPAGMPVARDGEFAFAASGTCLTSVGRNDAWFGTGGTGGARVFHSTDGGRTWHAVTTPVASGASSGIFSVAFRDARHGLAIGGDFVAPYVARRSLALTSDGGHSWSLVGAGAPGQYRSGAAWVPGLAGTAVAVGPTASDVTRDGGRTWTRFSSGGFDAVECAGTTDSCWASGHNGRAARLVWH